MMTLQELKQKGYKIYILSNYPESLLCLMFAAKDTLRHRTHRKTGMQSTL